MAQKTVFLEKAFWDKFSECSRDLMSSTELGGIVERMRKSKALINIYNFLCRSSVYIDYPLNKLQEQAVDDKDEMLQYLLQVNADAESGLEYMEEFPDLNSDKPLEYSQDSSAAYMTGSNQQREARKHGVLNICNDTIYEQEGKFQDTGLPVQKGKAWAWNNLDILKETSNAMILIDNFILKPDSWTGECRIDYNLRRILCLALPDSSAEKYVVSIFYFDDSGSEAAKKERAAQFEESIVSFVKAKKKKLNFALELFPIDANPETYQKAFHDRTLITNHVWIGSPAGFDLLREDYTMSTNARALKTTTIHGLYLGFGDEVARWLKGGYDNLISEAKNILKSNHYKSDNILLQ